MFAQKTVSRMTFCLASLFLLLISVGCSLDNSPGQVSLTFRYAQLSYDSNKEPGYYFVEDPEYPNTIETFTYDSGHAISQDDYDEVYASVSEFIPHNEGGYYVLTGFYLDMESPTFSRMFEAGYECVLDTTFYYSYEGGNSLPTSGNLF